MGLDFLCSSPSNPGNLGKENQNHCYQRHVTKSEQVILLCNVYVYTVSHRFRFSLTKPNMTTLCTLTNKAHRTHTEPQIVDSCIMGLLWH